MRYLSKIQITIFTVVALTATVISSCAKDPVPPPKTAQSVAAIEEAPAQCADGDKDGFCDEIDRCPMESGLAEAFGCPIDPCNGKPLLVLVQFNYDSSEMPTKKAGVQKMDRVLDAVAEAVAKDPVCRVCIIGHASEEGTSEYNQELSQERAIAVQGYMNAHDLAKTRIPAQGMGERCQLAGNQTLELNRRVEFRRLQDGESCPTQCSD